MHNKISIKSDSYQLKWKKKKSLLYEYLIDYVYELLWNFINLCSMARVYTLQLWLSWNGNMSILNIYQCSVFIKCNNNVYWCKVKQDHQL